MPKKPLEAIEDHFGKVPGLRVDRTKDHKLIDIIAFAITAVIAGYLFGLHADDYSRLACYCRWSFLFD